MSTARRRATYDDLMRVPETMVAAIIGGELITSPQPAIPHASAGTVIAADLAVLSTRRPATPETGWLVDPGSSPSCTSRRGVGAGLRRLAARAAAGAPRR